MRLLLVTVTAALAAGTWAASLSVLPYCELPSTLRECKSDANSAVRRSAASALPCFTLSNVSVSCIRSRHGNAMMAGRAPGEKRRGKKKRREEKRGEARRGEEERRR